MRPRAPWLPTSVLVLAAAIGPAAGPARAADAPAGDAARALTLHDLPDGFVGVPRAQRPPDGAAIFWRPEGLRAQDASESRLVGASSAVETFPTVDEARAAFGGMPPLERADARRTLDPTPCTLSIDGVDELECMRVVYEIEDVVLVEYRFRMLDGQRIAQVHLSARVVGAAEEPKGFRRAAVDLARRQAKLLTSAP